MKNLVSATLCTAVMVLVSKLPIQAATITLFDDTFNNADWDAVVEGFSSGVTDASFTTGQETVGGNPGAFRKTELDFTGVGGFSVGHW